MKAGFSKFRYKLPSTVAIVMVLGFVFVMVESGNLRMKKARWDSYYSVIIKNTRYNEIAELLHRSVVKENRILDIVSAENSSVYISDFGDLKPVPLAGIGDRFETQDPRRDRYINLIENYFFLPEENSSIIYIKSSLSPLHVWAHLIKLCGMGGWTLAEYNPLRQGALLVIFLAAAAILCLSAAKEYRVWYVLGAFPWVAIILQGDFLLTAGAILVFTLWVWGFRVGSIYFLQNLNHKKKSQHRRNSVEEGIIRSIPFVGFMLFLILNDFGNNTLQLLFIGILVDIIIAGAYLMQIYTKHRSQEHPLFISLKILPAKHTQMSTARNLRWFTLTMLCMPLLMFLPGIQRSLILPVPEECQEITGFGWDQMVKLDLLHTTNVYPDMADFISHIAYQEGIPFNRGYVFPSLQENIFLTGYSSRPAGVIVAEEEVKYSFDQEWYDKTLSLANESGVMRIHTSLAAPALVGEKRVDFFPQAPSFYIQYLLIWILFFMVSEIIQRRLTPYFFYGMRGVLIKKKQQAA